MKIEIAESIVAIVEFVLPRFTKDKLLHVPVDAGANIYNEEEEEEELRTHRGIHFLFHRPNNYTQVFIAIEGWEYTVIPGDEYNRREWTWVDGERMFGINGLNNLKWYMTSDHDSCWRSDGVSSPLRKLRNDMDDEITGGNRELLKDPYWHVSMEPIGGSMGYVTADVVVDEEANYIRTKGRGGDNYMKKPIDIKELKLIHFLS